MSLSTDGVLQHINTTIDYEVLDVTTTYSSDTLNDVRMEAHMNSSSNNKGLYFIVGALVIAVIGMGAVMYKNQIADKPAISIDLGEDGLDVETN